jgi:hypothetical protein
LHEAGQLVIVGMQCNTTLCMYGVVATSHTPPCVLQYVDLFSKDFIFVPIHEALHWSLAIICHPGNWHGRSGQGTACILHLDSMADGACHCGCTSHGTWAGLHPCFVEHCKSGQHLYAGRGGCVELCIAW